MNLLILGNLGQLPTIIVTRHNDSAIYSPDSYCERMLRSVLRTYQPKCVELLETGKLWTCDVNLKYLQAFALNNMVRTVEQEFYIMNDNQSDK